MRNIRNFPYGSLVLFHTTNQVYCSNLVFKLFIKNSHRRGGGFRTKKRAYSKKITETVPAIHLNHCVLAVISTIYCEKKLFHVLVLLA